jgi:hypothetical protein
MMQPVRFFMFMSNSLLSLPKRMGQVDGLSKDCTGSAFIVSLGVCGRPPGVPTESLLFGRYRIMPRAVGRTLCEGKLVEAPRMRYALSAICAYVCGSRCRVAEGDSPKIVRYVTEKRPSSRN